MYALLEVTKTKYLIFKTFDSIFRHEHCWDDTQLAFISEHSLGQRARLDNLEDKSK